MEHRKMESTVSGVEFQPVEWRLNALQRYSGTTADLFLSELPPHTLTLFNSGFGVKLELKNSWFISWPQSSFFGNN